MTRKINRSLYLKILLLLGISYILFFTMTSRTQKYFFHQKHFKVIQRNSANYANLLIDQVERAETIKDKIAILKEYDAELKILQSGVKFEYPENFGDIYLPSKYRLDPTTKVGFDEGLVVQIKKNDKIYQVRVERKDDSISYFLFSYRMLGFIYFLIMLIVVYYFLRKLLNPIRELHQNVQELSRENLDVPLETKRKDELGELIRSFNQMKSEINKMIESREQLLLDVSHELRTPLTRTNLSLEMMNDCEEKKDIVSDMREMETMVNELLESAKIQSKYGELDLEAVNLIDLICDISLHFDVDNPGFDMTQLPESVRLKLDPERIKMLLKNIFSNAVKYSATDAPPVLVTCKETDKAVVLSVKNYGRGIPSEKLEFIFEPFYRVDSSRSKETGGYGLGMHLVKKIVDAHNGHVAIDSEENEWTKVTVKLPKIS